MCNVYNQDLPSGTWPYKAQCNKQHMIQANNNISELKLYQNPWGL